MDEEAPAAARGIEDADAGFGARYGYGYRRGRVEPLGSGFAGS
jgi:hypothetical protein